MRGIGYCLAENRWASTREAIEHNARKLKALRLSRAQDVFRHVLVKLEKFSQSVRPGPLSFASFLAGDDNADFRLALQLPKNLMVASLVIIYAWGVLVVFPRVLGFDLRKIEYNASNELDAVAKLDDMPARPVIVSQLPVVQFLSGPRT